MTPGTHRTTTPNVARVLFAALPLAALCLAAACGQQADAEDAASERTTQDTATDAAPARSEARRTQSPTPEATRPNAADEYRHIWNAIDEEDMFTVGDSFENPTREAEQILADTWELYEALVEATKLEHCDWGIDFSDGIETLLPHLGDMRRLTRYLVAHGHSAVRWTDMDRARDATLSTIRMSRHVDGKILMEDLVAVAILGAGVGLIIEHEDEWREADRRAIIEELRRFDSEDPFDIEGSIEFDKRLSAESGYAPPDEGVALDVRARIVNDIRKAIEALER